MEYQLRLKRITFKTTLGVYDWEQRASRDFLLNLTLFITNASGTSDDLSDTVNYEQLVQNLRHKYASLRFKLLERLGEHIAYYILQNYPVTKLQLEIIKPNILPAVEEVGLYLQRSKQDG